MADKYEYAVQTKTYAGDDKPYDRHDDGSGWSDRRGKKYTLEEAQYALARQQRWEEARLVRREVSDWEEVTDAE